MSKKLVLLVDDEAWLTERMADVLKKSGYDVTIAPNAVDAVQQIDTRRPDILLLDMFMPGPNGIVLLHELQSYTDTATIPVVLCTNNASDMVLEQFAPYGVRRILDKTAMEPSDIVAAVRRYV